MPVQFRRLRPLCATPMATGAGVGLAVYGAFAAAVASAHGDDPLALAAQEAPRLLSSALLYAALGAFAGASAGLRRWGPPVGAAIGTACGLLAALALLAHPYALPYVISADAVLLASAIVGGAAGAGVEALARLHVGAVRAPSRHAAPGHRGPSR
ncbi:MAG: hypothetical protein ACYDDF_08070 [Thermoplasmatota archaeon]